MNGRFAQAVVRAAGSEGRVWVHDYQLQLVLAMVRHGSPGPGSGSFSTSPFPPVDIFERLPWRRQVLEGLLGADYIGFQTRRAVLNFAAAAREISGAQGPASALEYDGRLVRARRYRSRSTWPRARRQAMRPRQRRPPTASARTWAIPST